MSLSRSFYEAVLGIEADDTVPSRLYFHCGPVILALIDWAVESSGAFRPIPTAAICAHGAPPCGAACAQNEGGGAGQRFRGKPRSTVLVAGSGQRVVITLARV